MDQLINSISPASITAFFRKKAQKFRPETHSLDDLIPDQLSAEFQELQSLGTIAYSDSEEVIILSCRYTGELTSRSSKRKQYEISKKVLKDEFKDAAIFVFFDKAGRFRFSFVRANYAGGKRDWSTWKRFTYFVRPDKPNKTFRDRIGKCAFESIDAIQEAFSVEPLSKAFYKELSYWYFWAQKQVEFPNDTGENERTLTANAMIRMITRIIFIWFMKQKDLIPDELFDKEALDEIINYEDSTGSTYYKAILQNLFFATLNTPMLNDRGESNRKFVNRQYGIQYFFRYERFIRDKERFMQLMENVPFLNGGLFENLDIVHKEENVEIRIDCFSDHRKNEDRLTVPDYIFFGHGTADLTDELGARFKNVDVDGLIDILNRYDFTIDENTPFDVEVALDPELLGLVFENLLASYNPETQVTARKESGSFYTPREIVNYMVETSLIQSLKTTTGLPEEKIDLLVRDQEAQPFDVAEDRGKLIKSISDLKILDPAVGSGAFPMGMLQKMVHILGKLDADNGAWEKLQMDQALHDTEEAFKLGEQEERQTRLLEIEKAFDTAINEPDYARKLFLIENCLYGVDIQPIAVQICKLRFFISLLVDQKPDPAKENFGIVALPNLETKFVAANTLIGLPKPMSQKTGQLGSGYLRNTKIEELEKELEAVRHKHFSARTPPTKEKHRKRDKELRDEIAELLVNDGWLEESARMVAKWDPYDQNASSDWFDPEWMFGFKSFDIVIGNPPYIQLQNDGGRLAKLYKDQGFTTYQRTGDIYQLFYEKGINLLGNHGLLSYITSNKWMRTKYGESTREFLGRETIPISIIDFGMTLVFETATILTNILVAQKSQSSPHELPICRIGSDFQNPADLTQYVLDKSIEIDNPKEQSWVAHTKEEYWVIKKIESMGVELRKWPLRINYGIKTGYNAAFIIDERKRDELIQQDPGGAEIIKPILRGEDVRAYVPDFHNLWLLYIPWHFPLHEDPNVSGNSIKAERAFLKNYPGIYNHLLIHKDKLSKRNQVETGIRYEWYALQRYGSVYWKNFFEPKIIYPNMTKFLPFAYDEDEGYLCNDKAFIITGKHLKYLIGALNSRLWKFAFKDRFPELLGETREVRKVFFEKVPVKKVTPLYEKAIESQVDKIIHRKRERIDSTNLLDEVDILVYRMYELDYSEVRIIDPNIESIISREEYERFEIK